MDATATSNWERGAGKAPRRPILLFLVVILVTVAACIGFVVWVFNTPVARIGQEIYDGAPGVVIQWNSMSGTNGNTLTLVLAPDVTRADALDLQCRVVLPLLIREGVLAQVVIRRVDNDYQLNGDECPPPGVA